MAADITTSGRADKQSGGVGAQALKQEGVPPQGDQSKNPENKNPFADPDAKFTVHSVHDGWTTLSWEGKNGEPGGYAVTNGQSAMFFDETGNMVMSSGVPGDSGCGGKLIINATDVLQNAGTFALEAKGPKDGGTVEENKNKNTTGKQNPQQVKTPPAISLYASGNTSIESNGGEVGIKGDNIIINAVKTLTLKAGEAINIESGDGSGKVNIHTGDYNINAAFLNEKITGGKHQDVDGTSVTNQILPGAQATINSMGSINYKIQGNYYIGVGIGKGGHYNLKADSNITMQSMTGGHSLKTLGMSAERIMGHKKSYIFGEPGPASTGTDTWFLFLNKNKNSLNIKSFGGFNVVSLFGKNTFKLTGLVKADILGTTTVKSPTIFLN